MGEAVASDLSFTIPATISGMASLLEPLNTPQPSSGLPMHGVPITCFCGFGTGAAKIAVARNAMRVRSESCMMAWLDEEVVRWIVGRIKRVGCSGWEG